MRQARLWLSALLLTLPLFRGADAAAQQMTDPTRPPAGLLSSETGDNSAAEPVLQSVMISSAARTAIIGGETVKLGGMYGDARVIRITESEVVLRSASGTETLKMYPGVTIRPVKTVPAAGAKPAQKKRRPATNTRGKQG
jgi:MSHA biogenesis protein MshK